MVVGSLERGEERGGRVVALGESHDGHDPACNPLKRPEMARESARLITERPSLGVFSVAPQCRGGTRRSRIRLGAFASSGAAMLQGQRR